MLTRPAPADLRLYSRGYRAFTDVVSGSSAGCGTDGFPAEKGWDAVTGFGTPVSLAHAISLPPRVRQGTGRLTVVNSISPTSWLRWASESGRPDRGMVRRVTGSKGKTRVGSTAARARAKK